MRRLFVIVPLWLLFMTFALIGWNWLKQPLALEQRVNVLEERIQILERHLDSTGE